MTEAPPPATEADTRRVKTMIRAAAKAARRGAPQIGPGDQDWLEQHPQSLWPLLHETVTILTAARPDRVLAATGLWLLAHQLELIRYRLDRGYPWALEMVEAYQRRLIELARDDVLDGTYWLALVNILREAKVPVRPEIAQAMAEAVAEALDEGMSSRGPASGASVAPEPQAGPDQMRALLDELGRLSDTPFLAIEALTETGSLLPAEIRAFLAHELGLSAHAVLREAVPLLLLDPEPGTRQAAAQVLEQIAVPETFSPVMLRRCLLVRNWVPEADRAAIDRAVRQARLKGVVCAQWAPPPVLDIQCSMLDGSGTQAALFSTRSGRKGLLAGLLLKQLAGVSDAWCHRDVSRKEIAGKVEATRQDAAWLPVGRAFLDTIVQHHVHKGAARGVPPGAILVEIAEAIGAADWKDRALDVETEISGLYLEAGPSPGTAGQDTWLVDSAIVQSWFEDDPAVRALAAGKPRPKQAAVAKRVLEEILPARRAVWAERVLLLALWLRAGPEKFMPGGSPWRDCARLAHALQAGDGLADLPAMVAIAERSALAARSGRR